MIKLFEFAKKKQTQKQSTYKNQFQNHKQIYNQSKRKQYSPRNIKQIDNDFNFVAKSNKSNHFSQKSIGLSTLLHFAGEDDQSSIHIQKYQEDARLKKNSDAFMKTKVQKHKQQQLKKEINQMKQKRIALQKRNKQSQGENQSQKYSTQKKQNSYSYKNSQTSKNTIQKNFYQKEEQLQKNSSLLSASQSKPSEQSLSNKIIISRKKNQIFSQQPQQQSYFKYLLEQKNKLKLEKFLNNINKFYRLYLVKQILFKLQIKRFTEKIENKQIFKIKKDIFLQWKLLSREQIKKNQLIQTIKTKILNKRLEQ